jgi:hypothetical protein
VASHLAIITPAAGRALADTDTVRRELGIPDSEGNATVLRMILAASDAIKGYCGWPLARETVRETIDLPECAQALVLRRRLTSIVSLAADGVALTEGADFLAEIDSRLIYRRCGGSRSAWNVREAVVTYYSGYLLPSSADRTLPHDIEQACITMVTTYYQGQGRDLSVRSETAQDVGQTSWLDPRPGMEALLPQVAGMLEPYRAFA